KNFNILNKRLNNKLNTVKYRSFKIKEKLINNNYKLQLLIKIKVYSIFYISLLESIENLKNNKDEAGNNKFKINFIKKQKLE
ncbi:hypothetical protein BGW36DRAFT_296712, partial [Talaromyces proteolyticus]